MRENEKEMVNREKQKEPSIINVSIEGKKHWTSKEKSLLNKIYKNVTHVELKEEKIYYDPHNKDFGYYTEIKIQIHGEEIE